MICANRAGRVLRILFGCRAAGPSCTSHPLSSAGTSSLSPHTAFTIHPNLPLSVPQQHVVPSSMAGANSIPIRDVKIIYLVCAIVAMFFTGFRLSLRARRSKLWWDDALALLAALSTGLLAAAGWMHFEAEQLHSRTTKIGAYYLLALCFYVALWPARLSILYTIIRITPSPLMRRHLYYAAAVMGLMWAILFAQIFWVCAPMPNWTTLPAPQCPLPRQVGILQLVSDVLADGFLIAVPVRFFLNTHLDTSTKFRMVIVFGASILTTIVSLVHTYYVLKVGGADVLIAAIVEVAVSVIVCNLSVVVTSITLMCSQRKTFGEEDLDTANISTFGSWGPRSRKKHGDLSTMGLSEFTATTATRKDNETFIDVRSATDSHGQVESVKGPVVYIDARDRVEPSKAQLPGVPEE